MDYSFRGRWGHTLLQMHSSKIMKMAISPEAQAQEAVVHALG